MATFKLMRCSDSVTLLLFGLIHSACAEVDYRVVDYRGAVQEAPSVDDAAAVVGASEARDLAAFKPTMPPRPNTLPACSNPVNEKAGYEPVCPAGYFKCCAYCKGAVCFSEMGLSLSWRGVRECVRCASGDFCNGCDTYQRCRPSEIPGREGPRISPPGSVRMQDCEICPAGYEADLKRKTCVKKWTHVCNAKYIGRCVRNCKSEDAARMKDLTFCERMKCEIYCAKLWSNECVQAFAHECIYRKQGPSEYDLFSEGEEWLTECNVDCNGALSGQRLHTVALLCCAALAMAMSLLSDSRD